jgi:hypothetical protein
MKTNLFSLALVALLASSLAPFAAHAQISVGNLDVGTASDNPIGSIADGDIYNFGEVIDAPLNNLLSVSVNISSSGSSGNANVFLASWNPGTNKATTIGEIGTTGLTSGIETLSFNNLNIGLTAGSDYVIYVTTDTSGEAYAVLSGIQHTGYDLGLMVDPVWGSNTGSSPADTWVSYSVNGDDSLSINAEFSPVPESSTFVLAGLGLCGALAIYCHQRSKSAPPAPGVAAA